MANTGELAERMILAINAKDYSAIDELTAPEVQLRVPPGQVFYGREGVRGFFEHVESLLPSLTVAGRRIYSGPDHAIVEFDATGTAGGGEAQDAMGVVVMHFSKDKLVRSQLYLDTRGRR